MQQFLQFVLDPRVVFVTGLLVFGGMVLFAEISQRLDSKKSKAKEDVAIDPLNLPK